MPTIYDERLHDEGDVEKTPVEARQGETSGHMRYVLMISTALAIIALFASIFIW